MAIKPIRYNKANKEKRIRSRGMLRVGLSIFFTIIHMFVMMVSVLAVIAIVDTVIVGNYLGESYEQAEEIASSLQAGHNYYVTMDEVAEGYDDVLGIMVLDKYNNVTASYGDVLDFNEDIFMESEIGDRKVYINPIELAAIMEEMDISFRDIMKSLEDEMLASKNFLTVPCWFRSGHTFDDGHTVMFKTNIYLKYRDVAMDVILVGMLFFVMLISAIFLFIIILRSASDQKEMRRVLFTDVETGGANWLCFEEFAGRYIDRHNVGNRRQYAIVDIEIRNYRHYVTIKGPGAGTLLQEQLMAYLSTQVSNGKKEMVAHASRVNYALLLRTDTIPDVVGRVQAILDSFDCGDTCHHMSLHAGIYYVLPAKNHNIADCYNKAAMAKRTLDEVEGNAVAEFTGDILDNQLWEHKVEEMLDTAIRNRELVVYVQPKYSPVTEELSGAEALIRWNSPTEGFLSPGRFIPICERNGDITKIDDYMISNVARMQAEWIKAGKKIVPISVNVSRAHFAQEDLADHIAALVDVYDLPHEYLEIELTESAFFDDKEALVRIVRQLKDRGFMVSMDDFGTGYSSLNSLKDIPLDVLKLDADFFRGAETERAKSVVADAISLAKHLDMSVVAEGVEKKEQVEFLAEVCCDMIQGYYYSKPVPSEEYAAKLSLLDKTEEGM